MSNGQNSYNISLSKKLSYLLRHGALKEGLPIKPEGFVAVNELLSKSLHGYTLHDIYQVVKGNNKQRFTLATNNGVLEIKANQGHSIKEISNLSLKLLTNVSFEIIHGSYYKNWESIKQEGLCRMKRNHIHFAKDYNFKCGLRRNADIFIHIDFEKATRDDIEFFEAENGVIISAGDLNGYILPKYFKRVVTADMKPLSNC